MQLNNIEARKYDMISVPFLAGSNATKLPFPDQPQLRGVKVHGLELVYSLNDILGATNFNYTSTLGGVYIQNLYLTLYFNNKESVQNMPIGELSHMQPAGSAFNAAQYNANGIMAFAGQVITWPKSYLTLSTATPPATNGVFVIGVYYSL